MTEQIGEQAPTEEHPAARAARMIKELHEENIRLVDSGHKFVRMRADDVVEDVSQTIREMSANQIKLCDQLLERVPGMSREPSDAIMSLLQSIEAETTRLKAEITAVASIDKVEPAETEIPEVGNYEH